MQIKITKGIPIITKIIIIIAIIVAIVAITKISKIHQTPIKILRQIST